MYCKKLPYLLQEGAFAIARSYPTHCKKLPLGAESLGNPTGPEGMNLELRRI